MSKFIAILLGSLILISCGGGNNYQKNVKELDGVYGCDNPLRPLSKRRYKECIAKERANNESFFDVNENYQKLKNNLEKIEPGASKSLDDFLNDAQKKYEIAVKNFIYKPSLSPLEYMRVDLIKHLGRLAIFKPISKHIREFFTDKRIIQMLEFPGLLLGAKPSKTPALYSLMNYADIKLGTWYPSGGIRSVASAVHSLAVEQGVEFIFGEPINKIHKKNDSTFEVVSNNNSYNSDIVIANADYEHVESNLIEKKYRNYSKSYWEKRTMSPSALLFYIGINKKINIPHHCLFFDTSFDDHVKDIYDKPKWPDSPLFYVSCTSKTDPMVAPPNSEALFILIPVAPDLTEEPHLRELYLEQILDRLEKNIGQSIRNDIVVSKSYAHEEFISDFNSFKGNAYGLANTLFQTAFLKPRIKNMPSITSKMTINIAIGRTTGIKKSKSKTVGPKYPSSLNEKPIGSFNFIKPETKGKIKNIEKNKKKGI